MLKPPPLALVFALACSLTSVGCPENSPSEPEGTSTKASGRVVFATFVPATRTSTTHVVDVASGAEVLVPGVLCKAVSPAGKTFVVETEVDEQWHLEVRSFSAPTEVLHSFPKLSGSVAYLDEDTLCVSVRDPAKPDEPAPRLALLSLKSKELTPLVTLEGRVSTSAGLSVSPDGQHVAMTSCDSGMFLVDVKGKAATPLGKTRILNWSPDSSQALVWDKDRSKMGLALAKLTGDRFETVKTFPDTVGPAAFLSATEVVYTFVNKETRSYGLHYLNLETNEDLECTEHFPVGGSEHLIAQPALRLPEGRFAFVEQAPKSEAQQVVLAEVSEGAVKRRVLATAKDGGIQVLFSTP